MRKWLAGLAVLIILYFGFRELGRRYAAQAFNALIKRQLLKNYDYEYGSLRLDLWTKSLKIKDFVFRPDSSHNHSLNFPRIYQFEVQAFEVELTSLMPIFLDRQLIIEGVRITDPRLTINEKRFNADESAHFTTNSFSVFDLITNYVALFEVKNLVVDNAKYRHFLKDHNERPLNKFELNDVDFLLDQFRMDSTLEKRNFLNAKSIELIINDEVLYLGDQVHELSFDQFRLATQDSSITLLGVNLKPLDEAADLLTDQLDSLDLYHISLPELALKGIDFEASYLNQSFNINQLIIQEPDIAFRQKSYKSKKTASKNDALVGLVDQFSPSLSIHHLLLKQGNIDLDLSADKAVDLNLVVDSFSLYGLGIDSANFYFDYEDPPFKSFILSLSNVNESLTNQHSEIYFDRLMINSLNSSFELENLNIEREDLQQRLDLIQIKGLDYLGILFGKPLRISEIKLKAPQTKLPALSFQSDTTTQKESGFTLGQFKRLLQQYQIPSIQTQRLIVEGGQLEMREQLKVGTYNLFLERLNLDASVDSWKALTDSFHIQLNAIDWQLPTNQLQLNRLATNGRYLEGTQLQWDQESPKSNLKISVDQFGLYNLDLDSLLAQQLDFDSTVIRQPQVHLAIKVQEPDTTKERRKQPLRSRIPFTARDLRIEQGSLALRLANGDAFNIDQINTNISIDTNDLKLLELDLKHIDYLAQGFNHKLQLGELIQRKGNSYTLTKLDLLPQDTDVNQFKISIPRLDLEELDKEKLAYEGAFWVRQIKIPNPEFEFIFYRDSSEKDEVQKPLKLPALALEQFILGDAQFKWKTLGKLELHAPSFDFEAEGLNYKGGTFDLKQLTQLYQNVHFETKQPLSLNLKDSLKLEVKNFNMDASKNASVDWESLRLQQKGRLPRTIFTLEKGDLNALAIEELITDRRIRFDSLQIKGLELFLAESKNKKTGNGMEWPPASIKIDAPGLAFNAFNLDGLHIHLPESSSFTISDINLAIANFRSDSTIDLNRIDDYYGQLELEVSQIATTVGQWDEYHLSHALNYSSQAQALRLEDVQLQRNYTLEEFSELIDFRRDYFDIKMDQVEISHFKLMNLLNEPISFRKISLTGGAIDIFNDENVLPDSSYKRLLQADIKSIPIPFSIDTVQFDGAITLRALPQNASETTFLTIDNIAAEVRQISNDSTELDKPILLKGTGSLYKQANFATEASFFMDDPLNSFEVKGVVGAFDLPVLNQILIPAARIQVNRGESQLLTFEMVANEDYAIGNMFFRYKKLGFQIVNKEDRSQIGIGNNFLSFWANRLVKSRNPTLLAKKEGTIYVKRDKSKAFINLTVKGLLSGLVSSVGIKNNRKKLKQIGVEDLESLRYDYLFGDKSKTPEQK